MRVTGLLPALAICAALASCGGADTADTAEAPSAAAGPLKACDLLAAADPAAILGEPVGEAMLHLENASGGQAVSQCQFASTASNKTITLFVRRDPNRTNPTSRDAVVGAEAGADVLGMGEDVGQAIRAGAEVPGLGDLAFSYEMLSFNLMVFWNRHYQMIVMLDGVGTGVDALERASRVARAVMRATEA